MSAKPTVTVDVVSDVVCPWCYLGKHRLEKAVAEVPEIDVAIRWRPFQLDPSVPPEGMDRKDYIARKFGSASALDDGHKRLTEYGHEVGIDYHFDDITRSANTIDAHRLVRWASTAGKETEMVERLFRAYFSEGRDIGDHKVLAEIAGEIGLDAASIAARLATDEDRDGVLTEIQEAYQIGVTGVPCFILDRRYGVMGAQSVETLVSAIRQTAAKQNAPAA
jgi:predicted DsbA family dithiol-disulfide isomerase